MARITVEDCLEHVENRFSLVLIAAERTKQLMKGMDARVEGTQGNKEIVTALREIGEGLIKYHEKDPVEVDPEIAAAEVRRAVAARAAQVVERPEPVRPPPPPSLSDADDDDLDDADLDNFDDDFADDDDED